MLPKLWTVLALLAASAAAAPLAATEQGTRLVLRDCTQEEQDTAVADTSDDSDNSDDSENTDDADNSDSTDTTTTTTDSEQAETTTKSTTKHTPKPKGNGKGNGSSSSSSSGKGNYPEPKFKWGGSTKMRGVNLGGWLVLEKWMTGAIFEGTSAEDQYSFDEQAKNNPELMQKLKDHWASFITPDDIQQISDAGLNTVRIPIGYWSFLGGGYDGETYIDGALEYLDPVLEKCAELGIAAFIVLHGLPGSQNGQDNSGHAMGDGYKWYGNDDYRMKSIEAASKLVDLYGNGKFGGIVQSVELMNEPKPRNDDDEMNFQKDYFKQAYDELRQKDTSINIMYSDGWRFPTSESTWAGFGNGQDNVSMDTHIYTLFNDQTKDMGYNAILNNICGRIPEIESADKNMPTIIGEWTAAVSLSCNDGDCSTSTDDNYYQFLARSFETQTYAYEHATGWVYWNWKLDRDDAWSFQSGVAKGWIPKNLDDKPSGTPCQG